MKKLLCILSLLLALLCVFTACDNAETPSGGDNTPNTEQNGGGDDNQPTHTHAFGEWSASQAATCGTKGEEKRTCACGESETREIPATGAHTYGNWSISQAATCSAKGEEKRTCACGESETRETQATGIHTSGADGFCTACDQPLAPTEGVIYDLSNDRSYAMVLGYTGEAKRVIIADTYMDKPVKEIYPEAFENTTITAVVIPASVTSIGYGAFQYCTSLASVTFDDMENSQLTSIGEWAFSWCTSLASIEIPESVTSIRDEVFSYCYNLSSVTFAEGSQLTSIGGWAFYNCTSLASIEIPASVTSIGSSAFAGTYDTTMKLASVTFAENSQLTRIGDYAFQYCDSLASIEIPASVTSIRDEAFGYCRSLASVTFAEGFVGRIGSNVFGGCSKLTKTQYGNCTYIKANDNPYFLLYSCDNKNLSTYQIHEDTKVIGGCAFNGCERLSAIEIPESVTSIGSSAFFDCESLASIEIPASVTSIGYGAFQYCTSLASVTFENTNGWWYSSSSTATSGTSISATDLADPATAARYLRSTYDDYYWKRS